MTLETGVKALAEAVAVDVKALTDGKVDKELGKGLSESDYTTAEKTKLAGIAVEATKNRADSENADKVHTHTVDQVSGLGTAATANLTTSYTDGAAGRVLKVGDFGVGGVTTLNQSDWDALQPTGIYRGAADQTGKTPAYPAGAGSVIISRSSPSLQQMLMFSGSFNEQPAAVGVRLLTDTYNGDWTYMHHTGNLLQSTGTSTDFPMSQKATTDAIANIPSVPKSAAYTVTVADKGASIDTSAGVTIPASVFTVGDVIVVTNTSASSISITPAAGVTFRLAGSASTGLRTLAGYGVATLRMASSNVWFASGAGLS